MEELIGRGGDGGDGGNGDMATIYSGASTSICCGGGGIWRLCQDWLRWVEVMAAVAAYGEIISSGRGGGSGIWRLCQDWQG